MKNSLRLTLLILLVASVVQGREWTDASGQYQVVAEFIGLQGSVAYVRTLNGRTAKCELAELSRSDQEFVEGMAASTHRPGTSEAAPTVQAAATTSAVGRTRQASVAAGDLRFVYFGRYGTFHLYGEPGQATKAAEYSGSALCLSEGHSQAGSLKPAGADDDFLYFNLVHDDRETRVAFSTSPAAGELYGVWYWSSGKWNLYEAQKREAFAIAPDSRVPTLFKTAQWTTRNKPATSTVSTATTRLTSYGGGGGAQCGLSGSCSNNSPYWYPCWPCNPCWNPCWNPCCCWSCSYCCCWCW